MSVILKLNPFNDLGSLKRSLDSLVKQIESYLKDFISDVSTTSGSNSAGLVTYIFNFNLNTQNNTTIYQLQTNDYLIKCDVVLTEAYQVTSPVPIVSVLDTTKNIRLDATNIFEIGVNELIPDPEKIASPGLLKFLHDPKTSSTGKGYVLIQIYRP